MGAFQADPFENFEEKLRQAKEQSSQRILPELVVFTDWCRVEIPKPKPIIYALFDEAGSMVFGGGSKTFKSWAMMDLAVSVAHGVPWWGWDTEGGGVIYCNFELKAYYCRERFTAICKAKSVPYPERLLVWNLRGIHVRLSELRERLIEEIGRHGIACVFIDPFYKLLGERDERISAELMPVLELFDDINAKTGASTVCAAHYTKGNQAAKDPLDRISGGGALNRHPDCLLTLTRHQSDEAFSVDVLARDFVLKEPFVVRWTYPLLCRDGELDPLDLKVPRNIGGRAKSYDTAQVCQFLAAFDENGFLAGQAKKILEDHLGIKGGTFDRAWKDLRDEKRIYLSPITGKWHLKVTPHTK